MPIDFPDSPINGDIHTVGDITWTYDGVKWTKNIILVTGPTGPTGPESTVTGPTGATGPAMSLTYVDYVPTWTQGVTIAKTTNWARYSQLDKLVQGSIKITASSAGTANTKILVGLPVAASANNFVIGSLVRFRASGNITVFVDSSFAIYDSSTTMSFLVSSNLNQPSNITYRLGEYSTSAVGLTIASGDVFHIQFMYEAN